MFSQNDSFDGISGIRSVVQPYMMSNEDLLWCGRPYASVSYRPHIFPTVFMIFWLGFAVFWTVSASAMGGAFGLFGLPFLAVGGFALYTILIGTKKRYAKTVYAVTDKRALIISETLRGRVCNEILFSNHSYLSITATRGDSGTISFVPHMNVYRTGRYTSTTYHSTPPMSFEMIDSVQMVYRLISEQIANQKGS